MRNKGGRAMGKRVKYEQLSRWYRVGTCVLPGSKATLLAEITGGEGCPNSGYACNISLIPQDEGPWEACSEYAGRLLSLGDAKRLVEDIARDAAGVSDETLFGTSLLAARNRQGRAKEDN